MLITRQTAAGIEQLPWLRAVLALANEARLPLDEASAALRSGERRTFFSVFTTENDTMSDECELSDDEFEAQFDDSELDGFIFDIDDFEPEEGDDFADFDDDFDIAA
jgi:hypothetical protein